jgi:NAD(P) transhydrogenase subunit alpha
MVRAMRQGSVIVDLAADSGGNCELTKSGQEITTDNGVLILGYSDLPATLPSDASNLFARNVAALLAIVLGKEGLKLDLSDEIIGGTLLTFAGEVRHKPTETALQAQ